MVCPSPMGSGRSACASERSSTGTNSSRGTLRIAASTRGSEMPRASICSATIRARSAAKSWVAAAASSAKASRISEGVHEEPAAQLGLEPGALRRHQLPRVGDGDELLHLGGKEVQRHRPGAGVDALLQLGGAADAAHEIHVLVAPLVVDAEDAGEDLLLR